MQTYISLETDYFLYIESFKAFKVKFSFVCFSERKTIDIKSWSYTLTGK